MKILVINVPWMKYYVGEGDEEKLTPACGFNFQNVNGYYYGYGEGLKELAIERLEGVSEEDEEVEGVTIVWTAHNKAGENKVIGWYKNATVYRHAKEQLSLDGERPILTYSMIAKAEDCLLLPVELRLLDAPAMSEGVCYEQDPMVIRDLAMYIHNYNDDQMNYIFAKKDLEGQSILNFQEYEMYFAKADEFLAKDLYGKAVRCINKAIAVEPELAVGYEYKGSIFLSLKMYDEAIKVYERVIALEEDNELAHYCLGLLSGLVGDYTRAKKEYDYYLACRPEDINAVCERGVVMYHLGDIEGAKAAFARAYQMESDHPVYRAYVTYVANK